MHGVQVIGVTGACVVDVVVEARAEVFEAWPDVDEADVDEADVDEAGADEAGADEAEGLAALHPARAPAAASTRTIRPRDPTIVLATRESVARLGCGKGAPPVRPFL
jgi:hypothetical protein